MDKHVFPQDEEFDFGGEHPGMQRRGGMTLREHYAGLAMAAQISGCSNRPSVMDAADNAVIYADALIGRLRMTDKA